MNPQNNFQTDELIDEYKSRLERHMTISKNLQTQIDDAKTKLKAEYYRKKLVKNNMKCASVIMKLNRWMEMRSRGDKQ